MIAQRIAAVLVAFTLLIGSAPRVWACFACCPMPYPKHPIGVALSKITIDVNGQVAEWQHEVTFHNPNSHVIEGATAYLDIEPGAQVDDMAVRVEGEAMRAEILDAEKAKKVFQELIENGGSPALLAYSGQQLISCQIPRVPANGRVTMVVRYTSVIKKQGDLLRLQCLNIKANPELLENAEVAVNLRADVPVTNVYSPTHPIKIDEEAEDHIRAVWSAKDYKAERPFLLYYQLTDTPVAASMLAHRELDEEGTFMLLVSPTGGEHGFRPEDVLPKDVIFCVDTSGSMIQNKKIEQAREALIHCLQQLRPVDRFNVVDFSTSARDFVKEPLVEATPENVEKAIRYAKSLSARGGTAIQEAIENSLEKLSTVANGDDSDSRVRMIVFATDGQPTIGVRDPDAILRRVAQRNTSDARMFVFGEGYDVNTKLLDMLAANNRGEADYILPEENIGPRIASWFDRVGSPLLADLKFEFEGVTVEDIHPHGSIDLFRGEQLVILGRYDGSGPATLKISGRAGKETKTAEFELEFPDVSEDESNSFVPRVWAGRRVGDLLNELRLASTPDDELVQEVTYLAKRYGIITPYTSFLLADDILDHPVADQPGDGPIARPFPLPQPEVGNGIGHAPKAPALQLRQNVERDAAEPTAEEEKADRVRAAAELAEARREGQSQGGAAALDEQARRAYGAAGFAGRGGERKPGEANETAASEELPLRYCGTQAFYQRGDDWIDNRFSELSAEEQAKVEDVKIGTPRYFELLTKHPKLAEAFALGQVVLPIEGQWVRLQR